MTDKRHYESMLFNYETMYRTDYQPTDIKAPIKTVYQSKPTCLRIRPPPLKYIHTLTDWKEVEVPFDLYHKPKEIVRENPGIIQMPYDRPIDHERREIQKTRPRLVMTPAVSMDDIADDNARNILCQDMYTSTVMKANKEGAPVCANITSPFPGYPAPPKPIYLPPVREPYVSPEWRFQSMEWDGKQLRAYTDPTKEFWLKHPTKCAVCDATNLREQQKKLSPQ